MKNSANSNVRLRAAALVFENKLTLRPLVPDQGLKPLVLPALALNYIGEV